MKYLARCLFVVCFIGIQPVFSAPVLSFNITRGGDMPFPLGKRAPLPWEKLDGYWQPYNNTDYSFRIELTDFYSDGSMRVEMQVINSQNQVIAKGEGYMHNNPQDLHVSVTGPGVDVFVTLKAYLPKSLTNKNNIDTGDRIIVMVVSDSQNCSSYVINKVKTLETKSVFISQSPTPKEI